MFSSRRRGLIARVFVLLPLVGLLLVGLPVGAPVTSGGWPAGALSGLWNAVSESLRADPAVAEPRQLQPAQVGVRQGPLAPPAPPTRVREVSEKRTAHTRVFALSDGTFEAELSAEPDSFVDKQGRWRDVDTTIRPAGPGGRDGFRLRNDSNAFTSLFGDRSDRLVRFEHGGRQVTLGLDGAARTVEPAAQGSMVRYAGAANGADVVYQVTGESVKENIVLPAAPKDATFRFTLAADG